MCIHITFIELYTETNHFEESSRGIELHNSLKTLRRVPATFIEITTS